ncbi:MAG: M3 family oligoendopeptidase [bacterium]|nr:M3 family oligoendopeptidase [bacterium]
MKKRTFLPQDYSIQTWSELQPYYDTLVAKDISTKANFELFLEQLSELESVVSEDLAWKYIKMTCDTTNKALEESYIDFVTNIQPNIAPYDDQINHKIANSEYNFTLGESQDYLIYFRYINNAIKLYREENIPIQAELQTLAQKYGSITGSLSVTIDGNELTLQQASNFLKETDRTKRKAAYEIINDKRYSVRDELNELFNQLIEKRHLVATNTGYSNFRDYMHQAMGRFDYTVQDCYNFHDAIAQKVVPLCKELDIARKNSMQLETLKPYDMAVDPENKTPLKPFTDGKDLLEKSILCLNKVEPQFAENLRIMAEKGFLDLESRLGKAPGGYNYPLAESGIPFIFMNAAGSLRDVETMVHEAGHAMHSFLSEPLKLNAFKNAPMEVAEVASMAMELISMEGWDAFFSNPEDLKRAKIEQLEGVISTLPWIATIDAYQHWLYTNPKHTNEERTVAWIGIAKRFDTGVTDMTGYENYYANSWQKQLHLFEVPFYYIEYGFAQLGAIAIWRNVLMNKKDGLDAYKNMLSLGYTRTIPELYKAGKVEFNFTPEYVGELFDFVWAELEKLKHLS